MDRKSAIGLMLFTVLLWTSCAEQIPDFSRKINSTQNNSHTTQVVRSRDLSSWSSPVLLGNDVLPANSVGYLHGPELSPGNNASIIAWRLHEGQQTTPAPDSVGKITALLADGAGSFTSSNPIPLNQSINATLPKFVFGENPATPIASWTFQGNVYWSRLNGIWTPAEMILPGTATYPLLTPSDQVIIFSHENTATGFTLHIWGQSMSAPVSLLRSEASLEMMSRPVFTSSGQAYIAWAEKGANATVNLGAAVFDMNTGVLYPLEFPTGVFSPTSEFIQLALFNRADGGMELIIQNIDDVGGDSLYRSELRGTTWGQPMLMICPAANVCNSLRVPFSFARDKNGNAALAWVEDVVAGTQVFSLVRTSRYSNANWQSPESISPPVQSEKGPVGVVGSFIAETSLSLSGEMLSATWVVNSAQTSTLYSAHLESNNLWSNPEKIVEYIENGFVESASILQETGGARRVIWKQSRVSSQGLNFDIWATSGQVLPTAPPSTFDPTQPLPANHIPTTNDCLACHSPDGQLTMVDHSYVIGACMDCHNGVTASGKNITHIIASDACDACHTTTTWMPAITVDHTQVMGECLSCHNNIVAMGKPPQHIAATENCGACHSTMAWMPVISVDHNEVIGQCVACHNGTVATGKFPGHISTTDVCNACHSIMTWVPINVDHYEVLGVCESCHISPATHIAVGIRQDCQACHSTITWFNPTNALPGGTPVPAPTPAPPGTTPLPASHIPTSNNCAACHSPLTWVPVIRVDHDEVFGLCINCHNGVLAIGKSVTHVPSSNSCNQCHTVAQWIPAIGSTAPLSTRKFFR
ncbi:MAG: hypothetical protein OEZ43_01525 [Gammaproteobacteria bacterium]|nr:hypothetical protein [Gammaproteobacteria bacterium]